MTAPTDTLNALYQTLQSRKTAAADQSYVASLYKKGLDVILKKVGEECAETIVAAKNTDTHALAGELADLWFHTLVLMAAKDLPLSAVTDELARRMGTSGLTEKANRKHSGE